jgi:hypothetical protein
LYRDLRAAVALLAAQVALREEAMPKPLPVRLTMVPPRESTEALRASMAGLEGTAYLMDAV